jgi:putative ABC transport system permease protein
MPKFFSRLRANVEASQKYHSIHPSILLYIAWKNFTAKKLRSFLTVFGVVIGVSAIYFLLSFGLGIQNLVTTQVVGDQSLKAVEINSPNSQIIKLDEATINDIRTYPHVDRVGIQYSFPGVVSLSGGEVDSVVYGLDLEYQKLSNLVMLHGRQLQASDNKAVLMNKSALEAIGITEVREAINKEIRVTVPLERAEAKTKEITGTFTIVGVVESGSGSEIYMPSALFDIAGVPVYSQAKVVVDDLFYIDSVRKQIEANGLQTTSLTDTLNEIDNIFRFFNLVLVGFGSIGMIVAILGMFNTLTISLIERTKEIGLMMALGARRKDMRRLFIYEAALISLVGGLIGLAIAFVAGKIVNLIINLNAQSRGIDEWFELFATPLWSILAIIAATLVIGLVVVYLPARRAERINPIDALRRE